ncbi:MAG: dihydrofolate reductase [Bacteroidetes bacterium]|nr:dihydrofolate reductase [Bacteroidota bacterium]
MLVSLIVAVGQNNAIGKDGSMPWHLSADLKHFKNITWGLPVIMGRKTYDSLGKPLPGRTNIVVTRQQDWNPSDQLIVVADAMTALSKAKECGAKEVVIIGGGEIYNLFFDLASRIYLTRVEASPEADTYFSSFHPKDWKLISQLDREADSKHAYNYSFQVWDRLI